MICGLCFAESPDQIGAPVEESVCSDCRRLRLLIEAIEAIEIEIGALRELLEESE